MITGVPSFQIADLREMNCLENDGVGARAENGGIVHTPRVGKAIHAS